MIYRPAEPEDASQLAELIYLADKAHYATSGYAFSLGGTQAHQLDQLTRLTVAQARSQFHYSHFDVAVTPEGRLAASVAGFDRQATAEFGGAALEEIGWTLSQLEDLAQRLGPLSGDFPVDPPNTWTIEHVATLPDYRRRGLARTLLKAALERGRSFPHAAVDVFAGNDKALRLYHAVGFREAGTFGHQALRALLNRDPIIRLRRLV